MKNESISVRLFGAWYLRISFCTQKFSCKKEKHWNYKQNSQVYKFGQASLTSKVNKLRVHPVLRELGHIEWNRFSGWKPRQMKEASDSFWDRVQYEQQKQSV